MGFLDNSGDIILDAVLTDTGRFRLAKGDGSFKIVKYAFADDEINYGLYNKAHASGSAYYDLDILQTPILEAFTDNAAMMKSKLITIPRTDLFYLPVIMINELTSQYKRNENSDQANGNFVVLVDTDTEGDPDFNTAQGVMMGNLAGFTRTAPDAKTIIRLDQGLDTTEISNVQELSQDLVETQYIVEIDNKLGSIVSKNGDLASFSYLDDDGIATYFFSLGSDGNFVSLIGPATTTETGTSQTAAIAGPRGTRLEFRIKSSLNLQTSDFFFSKLGSTSQSGWNSTTYHFIDTNVKVTGMTTGYSVSIPTRFVKKA